MSGITEARLEVDWSPADLPAAVLAALRDPRHERVGGRAELMGPWQVRALRALGLRREQRLLDVGCGTLRGGLCLASYLEPGRYAGMEPNTGLRSVARELAASALSGRGVAVHGLDHDYGTGTFDWVLTQSVLNHLDARGIEGTIARVARALGPSGWWVGTIRFGAVEEVVLGRPHPSREGEWVSNRVSPRWFEQRLTRQGLAMVEVKTVRHPSGLDLFLAHRSGEDSALTHLAALMHLDTSRPGPDRERAVSLVVDHLARLGFAVELREEQELAPVIIARRLPVGAGRGRVVIYNHYDAVAGLTPWREEGGRIHGSGVADNKGPLAIRLAALERAPRTPEILWLIQGEEESGSDNARRVFPELLSGLSADLFIDESGWFDADGTQRILACRRKRDGAFTTADAWLAALVDHLASAAPWPSRVEARTLDKRFVPGGCAFHAALPEGARYLSIGPLDGMTRIHSAEESIARAAIEPAIAQFLDVLLWAAS